jgi:hypothetical protein
VIKNARRGDVDDTKVVDVCLGLGREADRTDWEAKVGTEEHWSGRLHDGNESVRHDGSDTSHLGSRQRSSASVWTDVV